MKQKNKKSDISLLNEWLMEAETSIPEMEFREVALEDYKFYAGNQDSIEVLEALEEAGRPASVYNEIKPKVDMLLGMAAEGRKMPDVLPVGVEDEPLAELMGGAIHHFHKKLKHPRKELDAFEHTLKGGRSLLYFWVDQSNPFRPKICSQRFDSWNFWIDPNSKEYDLSDARYLFLDKWITEDEFLVLVPGIDLEILKQAEASGATGDKPAYFNEVRERYRLVECWYTKAKKVYWFINPLTEEPESLTPEEFKEWTRLMTEEGVPLEDGSVKKIDFIPSYIERFIKQYYYMIFVGEYMIAGGETPYTHMEGFPAVLFGAYKNEDSNAWFGAIKMMKDPQMAINTMNRQLSYLLQTLPKGILAHEVGAIENIDDYVENSASPNFHLEISRGMIDRFKFIQQPQISPIYQNQSMVMKENMKDSSGVQDELMGRQRSSRDAVGTVRQRRETGMTVLYLLYDNFRLSRNYVTLKMMHLMQQFVTLPTIFRIEGERGERLVQINTQLNPESSGFNDISASKFDLEIDETIETATARLVIAELLMEYSHNNPDSIPGDVIIDYMNLPYSVKQRIKEYRAQQIAAQQAQQKIENEFRQEELEIKRLQVQLKVKTKNDDVKTGG